MFGDIGQLMQWPGQQMAQMPPQMSLGQMFGSPDMMNFQQQPSPIAGQQQATALSHFNITPGMMDTKAGQQLSQAQQMPQVPQLNPDHANAYQAQEDRTMQAIQRSGG